MNAMLTKYLKDFSVPEPVPMADNLVGAFPDGFGSDLDFSLPPEPAVDIEAERQQAYDHGFQEAEDYHARKHAEEIAALQAAHLAELSALADRYENEAIGMIHTRFHEMTAAISQSVAEQALQVLLPVFAEEHCRRSVAELATMVRAAIADPGVGTVVVRGPHSLHSRLLPLLEADGIQTRLVETDTADISVEIADTVLVTRLAAWAQALSEVSG